MTDMRNSYKILVGNVKGINHSEDHEVNLKITLK
jgi:hypothetical protein